MSRHANLIPSKQLNVAIPLPLFTRMTAELYSELECRVPHGAYSRCLIDLLQLHFAQKHLDLAPYAGTAAGACVVSGTPETLTLLIEHLS